MGAKLQIYEDTPILSAAAAEAMLICPENKST